MMTSLPQELLLLQVAASRCANNQTIMIVQNNGSGSNKAIVSNVDTAAGTFVANIYEGCRSCDSRNRRS